MKHSAVRDVTVSLRGGNSEIQLDVADQGVGFDSEAVMRRHGLGLIGMRERLSLVDGECMIDSRPGGGTRIIARVRCILTSSRAAAERQRCMLSRTRASAVVASPHPTIRTSLPSRAVAAIVNVSNS